MRLPHWSCGLLALKLLSFGHAAQAQTVEPAPLPFRPDMQTTVDRNGVDRSSGNIATSPYESIAIGNKQSGMMLSFGVSGTPDINAYIQIEKVSIYSGGFIAARVNGGGQVHTFVIGSISGHPLIVGNAQYHTTWDFGPIGTATSTSQTDQFSDVNDDGALLTCSGPANRMYMGGVCSLYLATSGTRIDYKIPSVPFDSCILARYPVNTDGQVAYAWPTKLIKPDGETISFNYRNYGEHDCQSSLYPQSYLNSLTSNLGFTIFESTTPTGSSSPGAFYPSNVIGGGFSLYAINSSREYADTLTTNRTFGTDSQSSSSITINVPSGYSFDRYDNGIKKYNVSTASGHLVLTNPRGGQINYFGVSHIYTPVALANGRFATPVNAFPYRNFTVQSDNTTQFNITNDQSVPEKYTEIVTNADGSVETYTVRYGNIQDYTDGIGRRTTYGYLNQEGYYAGIPGFSTISRVTGISSPEGLVRLYQYQRGALQVVREQNAAQNVMRTATATLASNCTISNYRICNKPQSINDFNGKITNYTYDPAHGGVLTETLPADQNGVRPQKRYTYAQLFPKILNASGQLVNSTPVWRVIRASECSTATAADPASCVGSSAERVATYAYNDNNLFLTSETVALGDGSQTRTTTYTYSYAGDITSIDGPRTDIDDRTYTTYDALRRKIFEIGPDPDAGGPLTRPIVRHSYDADGNEILTENGAGNAIDGSDFVPSRKTLRTFDLYGKLIKIEEVQL